MAAKKTASKSKSKVTDQATKEIRWTENKVALFSAFSKARATSASTAKTPEDIAKASNGKLTPEQVKHQCNPNFDLAMQNMIGTATVEGVRCNCFYATSKGTNAAKSGK